MCVRVRRSTTVVSPWDPARQVITIPAVLDGPMADVAVRATLAQLGVNQPLTGAVCWCGDPVHTGPHIPQTTDTSEVTHRGA
jgi:hypothetical protein